jgi:hypothetical protein
MTTISRVAILPREVSHITETSIASVDSEHPMTVDHILQRLEALRQRISIRWCGTPGAFAGYDELQIQRDVELATGCVIFAGRLVKAGTTTHTVELVASVPSACAGPPARILARGTGCTLQVPIPRQIWNSDGDELLSTDQAPVRVRDRTGA